MPHAPTFPPISRIHLSSPTLAMPSPPSSSRPKSPANHPGPATSIEVRVAYMGKQHFVLPLAVAALGLLFSHLFESSIGFCVGISGASFLAGQIYILFPPRLPSPKQLQKAATTWTREHRVLLVVLTSLAIIYAFLCAVAELIVRESVLRMTTSGLVLLGLLSLWGFLLASISRDLRGQPTNPATQTSSPPTTAAIPSAETLTMQIDDDLRRGPQEPRNRQDDDDFPQRHDAPQEESTQVGEAEDKALDVQHHSLVIDLGDASDEDEEQDPAPAADATARDTLIGLLVNVEDKTIKDVREVAPELEAEVLAMIDEWEELAPAKHRSRPLRDIFPSVQCADRRVRQDQSYWLKNDDGTLNDWYACRVCSGKNHLCLIGRDKEKIGDFGWVVRPLAPLVRKQDATPAERDFYARGENADLTLEEKKRFGKKEGRGVAVGRPSTRASEA